MNKPPLHIITPVSRPSLLPKIEPSIAACSRFFKVTWWVVYDILAPANREDESKVFQKDPSLVYNLEFGFVGDSLSTIGNAQNNWALDRIDKGWCYFLSDDNKIHPDLAPILHAHIMAFKDKQAFVFHQAVGTATRLVTMDHIKVNWIDLAQFVLHRDLIGDLRFDLPVYQSDGVLVEALHDRYPTKFMLIDEILSYYNALR